MYFTEDVRRATVVRLRGALVPGGWLAVSPAEASAELFRTMLPVHWPDAIFYRRPGGAELDPVVACATESGSAPTPVVGPPPSPPPAPRPPPPRSASVPGGRASARPPLPRTRGPAARAAAGGDARGRSGGS